MILKTLRILLAFSCSLLSLIVLAQENTSESELVGSVVTEKIVNDDVISQQDASLQSITQQSTTVKSAIEQDSQEKSSAQQGLTQQASDSQILNNDKPKVGSHVMANMDAGSMILSLLMVLALIIICAFVLKRFNLTQQGVSQLKVVTSLSLGAKERVVVIQAGEQQLLLGVTAQQVTLIERLEKPLATQTMKATELPKNLMSFLLAKKS
ncbi:flagellar biosynthetic protein FliO [Colwellia psychrerythraea]|uniref:Flagellar protein n=1 Tax=Colwellia psychrerythraea (strain 34H / ATCC BAA-681) TaxID=167879 RepID=Q485L2_COLP3|nr:flagellar biosynthetic protein FliO [Colwellia psychrerythraea]AAZ28689.1 flagellar protein FliO [Colwellia psychrerythraea 34H]